MSSEVFEAPLHIPPPSEGTTSEYGPAIERLTREHADHLHHLHDNDAQRESLMAEMNNEIATRVGSSWRKYQDFTAESRRSNYGLGAISLDKDRQTSFEAARRKAIASARAILTDARVNIDDLVRAREGWRAKLRQIRSPRSRAVGGGVGSPRTGPFEILEEKDVPERVRNATERNTPITKFPPYDAGATWWHFHRVGGEDPTIAFHLNASTGEVGHRPVCVNHDAGDDDGFNLDMYDRLFFWKNIPKTGAWDTYIKAVCTKAKDYYWLENEWGWSDADNEMYAGVTFAATTFPPVNLANDNPYGIGELWDSYWHGVPSDTETFANTWRSPGQAMWFHYKTPFEVPANSSTLIEVGTYASIDSYLNDTSATLILNNWWTIEQVSIEIV